MRWGVSIIILAALSGGCAVQPAPRQPVADLKPIPPAKPIAAASLAFDPPVIIGQPPIQMSREGRSPDAFVGYETTTITSYYIRSDDRQLDFGDHRQDLYDRRAISTKVGVSYR